MRMLSATNRQECDLATPNCPDGPEGPTMLRSYSAQLNGTELIWLDRPPADITGGRVLNVVDDANPTGKQALKTGRRQWRGDAVAAQRAQRDA